MQKFIPDFAALGNIDWSKPQLDTKNKQWNIMAIAAVAMLITIFLPWFYSAGWAKEMVGGQALYEADITASGNGFGFWYGILAFIFTLVALASIVYKQYKLFFWATALSALMGVIAIFTQNAAVEVTQVIKNSIDLNTPNGTTTQKLTADEYKALNKLMNDVLVNIPWGAIIHVVAAVTGFTVCRKLILKGE
jgi:hypothetical protein